jgi:hypothetical protein
VHPPVEPDEPDDDMVPDECNSSILGLDVLQNVNIQTVFVDPSSPDAEDLGTVYIFNDNLANVTIDGTVMIMETWFATGSCTRTQNLATRGVGGGMCDFVYTLTDSDGNFATFTASGEVFDGDGGILPITGGARAFIGAAGIVQLTPFVGEFDDQGELIGTLEVWEGDFWEADVYQARVELESPPSPDCLCGCSV